MRQPAPGMRQAAARRALITAPWPMVKVKGFCPASLVLQKGTARSRFLPKLVASQRCERTRCPRGNAAPREGRTRCTAPSRTGRAAAWRRCPREAPLGQASACGACARAEIDCGAPFSNPILVVKRRGLERRTETTRSSGAAEERSMCAADVAAVAGRACERPRRGKTRMTSGWGHGRASAASRAAPARCVQRRQTQEPRRAQRAIGVCSSCERARRGASVDTSMRGWGVRRARARLDVRPPAAARVGVRGLLGPQRLRGLRGARLLRSPRGGHGFLHGRAHGPRQSRASSATSGEEGPGEGAPRLLA